MSRLHLAERFNLGPIDQISFAVNDVERSLAMYELVFDCTFSIREVSLDPGMVTFRGRPAATRMRLAFGETAGIELELVQVLSGPSPVAEHLHRHGEGLHHVRFQVDDVAAKVTELEDAGFEQVFGGETPRGSRFAFVELPTTFGHTAIELIQRR